MKIGPFVPLELEVVNAMLDMADIKPGEKHIELGSGDGRFVGEATKRGADSVGYEIDKELYQKSKAKGLNIFNKDLFKVDVSDADVVTFWFTDKNYTTPLLQKLYNEMKPGAKLVMLGGSLIRYRDGQLLTSDADKGIIDHAWKPITNQTVLGNRFNLYIR